MSHTVQIGRRIVSGDGSVIATEEKEKPTLPEKPESVDMSLFGYIHQCAAFHGVPLTKEGVVDLLATTPIVDLLNMKTSSSLKLADEVFPQQLAFAAVPSAYLIADDPVVISGNTLTVADAISQGFPVDFVLACHTMPDIVARFYVLACIHHTRKVWYQDAKDINLNTKFDAKHLHASVMDFLDRKPSPAMLAEWESLFGMAGMLIRSAFAGLSNKDVVEVIMSSVLVAHPEENLILPSARKVLQDAASIYGIASFSHFYEAMTAASSFRNFVSFVSSTGSWGDNMIYRIGKEVSAK